MKLIQETTTRTPHTDLAHVERETTICEYDCGTYTLTRDIDTDTGTWIAGIGEWREEWTETVDGRDFIARTIPSTGKVIVTQENGSRVGGVVREPIAQHLREAGGESATITRGWFDGTLDHYSVEFA